MVKDKVTSKETIKPKALSVPSHMNPDRFTQQLKLEKEWNEKMEHLNDKYNLDYSSESDSKPKLDHKYETDIKIYTHNNTRVFSTKYQKLFW